MVKMINCIFGNEMWVAEDRVKEYQAAGHKLAAEPEAVKPAEKKPKRRTSRPAQKGGAEHDPGICK